MDLSSTVWWQDAITKSMQKDMVEPKRKYVDTEASYKKHLLSKASGPGGLLLITVVQARDLRSHAQSALLSKKASGHIRPNIQKHCCERQLLAHEAQYTEAVSQHTSASHWHDNALLQRLCAPVAQAMVTL